MAKLPHHRNSRTSTSNYEPMYLANFEVILTPPPAVAGWDLVMENVTKIGGLETNKMPEVVDDQQFKGNARSFAGGTIAGNNTVDLTLDFEVNLNDNNSAFVYKALKQWTDIIYDPLTGRRGLKKDYLGGPMVISMFNNEGDIFMQWKFPEVFPTSAAELDIGDLSYDENGIFKIEGFTLRADYFEHTIL